MCVGREGSKGNSSLGSINFDHFTFQKCEFCMFTWKWKIEFNRFCASLGKFSADAHCCHYVVSNCLLNSGYILRIKCMGKEI